MKSILGKKRSHFFLDCGFRAKAIMIRTDGDHRSELMSITNTA